MRGLEDKREHLEEWWRRFGKASEIAPNVQRFLEVTRWETEALDNRPDIADEIPVDDLGDTFQREYANLKRVLPMMPEYDTSRVDSLGTALSTSSSASTYVHVLQIGTLPSQEAHDYAAEHTWAYRDLQKEHSRPQEVRSLLAQLGNPQTLDRFDSALNAVLTAKGGIGEREAAANAMRNLLDGVKGDLWPKARQWRTENMTWEKMAKRLTAQKGEAARKEVLAKESQRQSLYSQLTNVLKDREGGSVIGVNDIWVQVLDHLYVVLTLVEV